MSDVNDPKPYPSMKRAAPAPAAMPAPKAAAGSIGGVDSAVSGEDDALNARIAELRAKRVPFGRRTQKLAYARRPGYRRHWFADHPGRVEEARAAGWEHVKDHEGKIVSKLHGRHRDGRAMIGYLLEIPEVLWREDLAADQRRVDEGEQGIRSGNLPNGVQTNEKQGNFYTPGQGISIKNEAKR
jgi:hypothetical protein